MNSTNLSTKRQWIAELAKRKPGGCGSARCFLARRVPTAFSQRHRQRTSLVKNRMPEIGTSGSVGDGGGNAPIYPATLSYFGRFGQKPSRKAQRFEAIPRKFPTRANRDIIQPIREFKFPVRQNAAISRA